MSENRRRVTFIKDITVNVLANLIAGALVYLGGVAAGVFPRSAGGVAVALCALGISGLVVSVLADFLTPRAELYSAVAGVLLGAGLTIAGATGTLVEIGFTADREIGDWIAVPFGVLMMLTSLALCVLIVVMERGEARARRRIRGLQWIP